MSRGRCKASLFKIVSTIPAVGWKAVVEIGDDDDLIDDRCFLVFPVVGFVLAKKIEDDGGKHHVFPIVVKEYGPEVDADEETIVIPPGFDENEIPAACDCNTWPAQNERWFKRVNLGAGDHRPQEEWKRTTAPPLAKKSQNDN